MDMGIFTHPELHGMAAVCCGMYEYIMLRKASYIVRACVVRARASHGPCVMPMEASDSSDGPASAAEEMSWSENSSDV